MLSQERRKAIRSILEVRRSVRVRELSERLGVSEVTIRKDLAILEEMGYLQRAHGGAVLAESTENRKVLAERETQGAEAKERIAAAAAELIVPGETIFIDSGSTCAALARLLVEQELRVVTNSLQVMLVLADRPGIALHSLGGSYRQEAGSFIGPIAEAALERMQIDLAFLGATGVGEEGRFSSQNSIESQLKRSVIRAAHRSVLLFDASKIGQNAFSVFATLQDLSAVVTDADPNSLSSFAAEDVEIICTEKGVTL